MVPKSKKDQVKRTKLALHVMRHLVFHDVGGIADLELGGDDETEEVVVREVPITILRVSGREERQTLEEPQEEGTGVIRRVNLLKT